MTVVRTDKKFFSAKWLDIIKLVFQTKTKLWPLGIAIIFELFSTIVGLIIPAYTKNFIDNFRIKELNIYMILLLVVFFLVRALFSGISIYMLNKVGQKLVF